MTDAAAAKIPPKRTQAPRRKQSQPALAPAVIQEALPEELAPFAAAYEHQTIGRSLVIHADCFEWLGAIPANSLHAIITDPPYGVKEYDAEQIEKRANGSGGIWRIPPSFDGNTRAPLPRFTALNTHERDVLQRFFTEWAWLALRALRPGGHVFLASNAYLSQLVFSALVDGGLEFRGELIRLVRTLRGGDRPKNAEREFPDVCSLPRGCYEPWGIFRKPLPPKMKVSDCLREFQTGALRRRPDGKPFSDVLLSERTPRRERAIANHPSLKPQSLLRQLVYAALPLGEGLIADPFMGSGSTIAAAEAVGARSIGVERFAEYYAMSLDAIPKFVALKVEASAQRELVELERDIAAPAEQLAFSFGWQSSPDGWARGRDSARAVAMMPATMMVVRDCATITDERRGIPARPS